MKPKPTFGEWLADELDRRGWTQAELAEQVAEHREEYVAELTQLEDRESKVLEGLADLGEELDRIRLRKRELTGDGRD